jgi:serine protease Do
MTPDGAREPVTEGEGSGFLISPNGYIATNDHVVGSAQTVQVTFKDGRTFTGKVTRGNDANSDIALVKIDGTDLPYLSFADSSHVEPGEFAMAIGAPFGLENTVTVGHVSALGRSNLIGTRVYTDLIQTDAAINMGNSGGPLVNVDGQVIGMNTAIYSPTGGSNGIGFAIPGNQVKLIENLLTTKGKLTRSMLGVIPEDLSEWERSKSSSLFAAGGARVHDTPNPGTPAALAGIQKGDVIVKVGSMDIHGQLDLRNAMLAYAPNTTVPIQFIRDGHKQTVQVKLAEYTLPTEASQPGAQQRMPRGGMPFNPFGDGSPFGNESPFGNGNGDETQPQHRSGQAQLGVQVQDVDAAARSQYGIPADVKGAVVVGVVPGTVADKTGIQPGDVIQSLNGKVVSSGPDLKAALKGINWGSIARIKFVRFGQNGEKLQTEQDVKFE